jgi:Uma2 family endonuclease
MASVTKPKLMTAEEFMNADLGEGSFELVRGEVVAVPPPRPQHGLFCANVAGFLWEYGRRTGHGYVLSNDSAVKTQGDPDTVRGTDICYYSNAPWPRSQVGADLPPVPPDLAVEVLSPGNRPAKVMTKVWEYLEAGVLMVWVLDPKKRRVLVYRPDEAAPIIFNEDQVLEGFPELPGFRCAVADFFV